MSLSSNKQNKSTRITKSNLSDVINNQSFRRVRNIVLVDSIENINKSKSPPSVSAENKLINISSGFSNELKSIYSPKEHYETRDETKRDPVIHIKTIKIKSIGCRVNSPSSRQEAEIYKEVIETVKYIQNDGLISKIFGLKSVLCTK